jgi:hypothetical protein
MVPRPMPAAPRRYLIVMPRPLPAAPRELPAAPLVVRRRYLIVLPRSMLAAPCRYLILVSRPLLAVPLVVCRRYLFGRGAQAAARGAVALSQQEITTRQMFSGTEPIIPAISVKPLKLAHRASSSSALS